MPDALLALWKSFIKQTLQKYPTCCIVGDVKTMRKLFILAAVLSLGLAAPYRAWAVTGTANIIIVEVQTGTLSSGTEEFVELYNPNANDVDVTDWQLQYRSASSTGSWTTKRKIACEPVVSGCTVVMPAHGRLVLASYTITGLTGAQPLTSGMADAGGQVQLLNPGPTAATTDDVVNDMLGYGTATAAEGAAPAPKPPAGKSLKRLVSEDGYFIDTNVNATDFIVGCDPPTPGDQAEPLSTAPASCPDSQASPPPDETPDPPTPDPGDTPPVDSPPPPDPVGGMGGGPYLPVLVNELLPDPAAPALDANDEFVELFNPNNTAVNLKDYQVQSGTSYHYKYSLPDVTIGPLQYLAITSEESGLVLSNSGTSVRVLDPSGQTVDETGNYGAAVEGQSWSKTDAGDWQWSTSLTPGQPNIVTAPAPKATAKTTAVSTTKKTTSKAASTSKPKVAGISKTVAATSADQAQPDAADPSTNYWLLGGVGSLVLGYGLYEYRQGIGQGLRKVWHVARGKNAAD